jgi:hypothetical protein
MSNTVYQVNKGINKPIEFRGLRAQYIWWLGGAVIILLILFAILYIAGVSLLFCTIFIFISGAIAIKKIYRFSEKYGADGMMKKIAKRKVPKLIKSKKIKF